MALSATIYTLEVTLNDADRGVYESLSFRAARHPSESEEYLATRVLAYCLEHTEGLAFSKGGLSDPELPALSIRDLTGTLQAWIEVGLPEAARLHKAAKAAPRLVIYPHKDIRLLLSRLAAEPPIHRSALIEIYEIDPVFLASFVKLLDRRMRLDITISDRQIYLTVAGHSLNGAVVRYPLG